MDFYNFLMRTVFLLIFYGNSFNIRSYAGCVDKQINTTDQLLEENMLN